MKNLSELEKILLDHKFPKFRAKQVIQAVCQNNIDDYEKIHVLPKDLRTTLNDLAPILSIQAKVHLISKNSDTEKVLFQTHDHLNIEAVLMKYQDGRNSVCVSCQAGCQMGCKFCATGTLKFGRSLTYEEIFDQVLYFTHQLSLKGQNVSNVIFMGMGEPFMNYDQVLLAANLMNNPDYLNIGARKITISTSGIVDGIKKFTQEPQQYNLAVSLHSPDQETREKIMPVAKRWKLPELMEAINQYISQTNRRVSFEYVMLKDINDSPETAEQLARICQNNLIHINLIPYNNTSIEGISGSHKEKIYQFQKILQNFGINATVRTTMGQDIAAACGQLANKTQ